MPQQPDHLGLGLGDGDELAMLRQQTEAMNQQMQQIQERIRQLEQEG